MDSTLGDWLNVCPSEKDSMSGAVEALTKRGQEKAKVK